MGESSVGRTYLAEARRRLAACHERITHCLGQLDDAQVWWRPREPMNSVGNIVLHLCGNLRQWLVSGVGGAPDVRDRPGEFAEQGPIPKGELLARLGAAVGEADAVLAGADEAVLLQPRRIQGFEGTVLSAVFDSLAHLSGHAQEVVYITRLQLGDQYHFAWVPATPERGASPAETVAARDAAFKEMPAGPLPSGVTAGVPPRHEPSAGVAPEVDAGRAEPPESPLRDYPRDLEQEFQDDEGEEKV